MKYVMKLRFVVKNQTDERTNGRTNGDIEALADAGRALENIGAKLTHWHMPSLC